jgi:hypothetical protein
MDLFLDKPLVKTSAYAARLSEKPENWPQELESELVKQLPYLSDYEVGVTLDRVDTGRGFAFGYAHVANRMERPPAEMEDFPSIRIPIVIRDSAVKPFAVFLDGEHIFPLNEERVREALFNPATFDLTESEHSDPSLIETLMPPHRSGLGVGGHLKTSSKKTKQASFGTSEGCSADGVKSWVDKFRGTPFFGAAVELEKKDIEHRLKSNARDLQRDPKKEEEVERQRSKIYTLKDRLRTKRQMLELKLAILRNSPQKAQTKQASLCDDEGPSWVEAFAGTPLMPEAIALEAESVKLQILKAKLDQQSNELYRVSRSADRNFNTEGDEIRNKKKELELKANLYRTQQLAKTSSSLLEAIAPTIRESDAKAFVQKLASDRTLQAGFRRSGVGPLLVDVFEKTKRASADYRFGALASNISPTCVTVHKLPGGGFLVKSANVNAFVEKTAAGEVMTEEQAAPVVGPENAQTMQPGQTETVVADPVEPGHGPEVKAKPVEEFGQYKVQDAAGNSLLGHVFPETLAWDGSFQPQPVAVFTNGSVYAMQDQIAGELVGKGTNLPVDPPSGDGVFYTVEGGDAICTMPVTVHSTTPGVDGQSSHTCSDAFGSQFQVHFMPELKAPQMVSEAEFAFPANWHFMRLGVQTQVAGAPEQMGKAAAVRAAKNSVTLFYNGSYNLTGGCGLDKISSSLRYELGPVEAEFALGVLGVPGPTAKKKLAEARKKGEVKLSGLREITTLAERYAERTKTAAALLRKIPDLRCDLVKEAAEIPDGDSVDKVLALNFINPENAHVFVNYLPDLDKASCRLAEMLLWSYLGQDALPEAALSQAMRGTETVISGLKALAQTTEEV